MIVANFQEEVKLTARVIEIPQFKANVIEFGFLCSGVTTVTSLRIGDAAQGRRVLALRHHQRAIRRPPRLHSHGEGLAAVKDRTSEHINLPR